MARRNKPKLRQVNFRALASDVEFVRAVADREGVPWNLKLRLVIHEAVLRLSESSVGVVR